MSCVDIRAVEFSSASQSETATTNGLPHAQTSAAGTAHATTILVVGAAGAAAGTIVLATAGTVAVALIGLGLAAAGTAVLYPTLLSLITAHVDEASRGAATSVVATTSYLGFLAGPVYVGRWSAAVGLSGAMLAVAALAAVLALLAWPALRTHHHIPASAGQE